MSSLVLPASSVLITGSSYYRVAQDNWEDDSDHQDDVLAAVELPLQAESSRSIEEGCELGGEVVAGDASHSDD
jgi:hypothetical protein